MMNKPVSFWKSLEQYTWKLVGRNPLPWPYMGVGIVLVSLLASMVNARYSTAGARTAREVVEWAARVGDYEMADTMYRQYKVSSMEYRVLGAETEIESLVYPERVVESKIIETEELLTQYPGHRDILVELARLYGELDDNDDEDSPFCCHRTLLGLQPGIPVKENPREAQGGREKPRPYGDIAREYWEQARILDPNNEMFEGKR